MIEEVSTSRLRKKVRHTSGLSSGRARLARARRGGIGVDLWEAPRALSRARTKLDVKELRLDRAAAARDASLDDTWVLRTSA
jgi:hypothetical protein